MSHYRPNWSSERKPEQNCAQLLFTDKVKIDPGETHECLLEPFAPHLWEVEIGDILDCMEGTHKVGEALVLEIL